MSKKSLKIHSENILPIIKKWLYSDKDIFLRELISNACDAMRKLQILRDRGEIALSDDELRIEIQIDKEKKQLKILDTGIGMTADEVERYIAQLAFSGAEEFLSKYTSNKDSDQVIGHFGLGFYSAFMVSEKVEINTLSYTEGSEPAHWSCDGSSKYTLEKGMRETRGTEIILSILEGDEEYLETSKLRQILETYCRFLPFPIYLEKSHINAKQPLWLKGAAECTEKETVDFYHTLYPLEPDPIFWVHLSVDYPFNLKGILYFPKITKRFDFSKSAVQLYCNRVFVSDQCRDLMPDYLTILRGAIDSPDIPLNVSRSTLQMDRTVRQLASHISKKIADRIASLYQNEKERYIELWPDIEMIIKLGALQDEKFYEKVKPFLIWKTSQGQWVTVEEYLEKYKTQGKVYYTQISEGDPLINIYKSKGIDVLIADEYIDTSLMSFLEHKLKDTSFERIDGTLNEQLLDKDREQTLLDAEGKTAAVRIADSIRKLLNEENLEIEAKSLASDSLPGFLMVDEAARRMREFFALSQKEIPGGGPKSTFVVNTNSPLIHSLLQLNEKEPNLAQKAVRNLYELALLSQRELDGQKLSAFIENTYQVVQELAQKAANN